MIQVVAGESDRRHVKIVATLGPASSDPASVRELVRAGLDVARINFSHGDRDSWAAAAAAVRAAQSETGKPIAILGDLQGPKIRVGEVPDGCELARDDRVDLIAREDAAPSQDGGRLAIGCSYLPLADEVEPGARIFLRDGEIELRVDAVEGDRIETTVRAGGRLASRAGLHAADVGGALPAVTDDDRGNIRFAAEAGFDYLALSFVRRVQDVRDARDAIGGSGRDLSLIAKIETVSAMRSLPAIIAETDGVMVARGDLGVEAGAAEVPVMQREIVAEASRAMRPVIIATQMLESMTERARPTRAEASDVANAVWDGADALMLSAETAVGRHPARVIEMMDGIIRRAERIEPAEPRLPAGQSDIGGTIARSVRAAVRGRPHVRAVAAFTASGRTGRLIARERLGIPVLVLAPSRDVQQRLALLWGVQPWLCGPPASVEQMLHDVERGAREALGLESGDEIVVTGGLPLGEGQPTNFMKLHEIP